MLTQYRGAVAYEEATAQLGKHFAIAVLAIDQLKAYAGIHGKPVVEQVLKLIALGHTNSEIAGRLYLSVRTVESHRAHIQQKTRRSTRAELVRYALEHGLVELTEA